MGRKNFIFQNLGLVWCAVLVCLAVGSSYGQRQQAFIQVIDQINHEPVAFAHVCFAGIKQGSPKYGLTSIDGKIPNDVKEISKIIVSYMGYTTYRDTIRPGQSLEIQLTPAILNMDEVVVTGQYSPEKVDRSIYRVDVISSRMIEMKAATNMAELLKDQSSMRVSQDGVLGTSLTIQGLSGENVKFLQNGVPLIGRMNGNFDLNQINLNNVDHVEVVEGPMSVIYGSNALAGVVNIITKENKSSVLSASANAYYESVGVYNTDASVSLNKNKNGFFLDGGRNFFQGYSYKDTSRVESFKPRRQYFFDGFYAFTGEVMKLKVSGDYFNELLLNKGALMPAYYETALDSYFTTVRYTGRMDAAFNLPRNHYINLVASYSSYSRQKNTYFRDLTKLTSNLVETGSVNDTTGIQSLLARGTFANSNAEKKFNYQAGFDLNVETGTGKRILGQKQEIGDYAGFISLKWDPVPSLSFQPGLRVIHNTKYQAPLVYALSTKWSILDNLNLRLSYSRGFRTPDMKELYLSFIDIIHNIHGNPDLKAERSHNINLNLSWNKDHRNSSWVLQTTGFYNSIENVIILARVQGLEYQYVNLDKYKTTGFQLEASWSLYPTLRIQAGVAETGVTATANGADQSGRFIMATDLTLSGSYRIPKPDLTFSVFYKYTGKTPGFQLDDNTVSTDFINPYHTMDLTAVKGFWKQRIRLSAGVKNLFDTKTIPATGTTSGVHGSGSDAANIGWGRTFFLRLSLTLNKYK
ncbi:MAG: TonB-dependent receptor [Bacteroidetes bacterium]|nr:MAG: TonB-dependent receptor [Bacteroidota bacterium]